MSITATDPSGVTWSSHEFTADLSHLVFDEEVEADRENLVLSHELRVDETHLHFAGSGGSLFYWIFSFRWQGEQWHGQLHESRHRDLLVTQARAVMAGFLPFSRFKATAAEVRAEQQDYTTDDLRGFGRRYRLAKLGW
ncbi:hypothetical protein NOK12_02730 [Nocardioides sp. OK12]|uniref:hypothetical protein n=1 Tax=Nocardioides sp. OK12 TaxID=2758661 RepID=UPI0021C4A3D9|nr:hypothetical protein [Nocardioides sp. OK12]GHJ57754.1 hypothetical protein NOK12_02730 [Nocardioides sp. OK12]